MRTTCRLTVLAILLTLGVLLTAGSAAAVTANTSGQTFQNGNCLDVGVTSQCGGWDQTTPGVAGRPYVQYLAVTNGGTTTVIIDNTAGVASPLALNGSDVYAVVSPTNSCQPGQAAAAGVCYAVPNRVSVSLVHETSLNNWSYDFTTSSSSTPSITSDSVIDLIVGIRSTYSTLRWSWVNGVPNYWSTTPVSPTAGDAHVKFTPKTMPVMTSGGCSQIPVSTCDIARADREVLQPNLLLSMDNTLDVGLAGVLFGTSSAFIGSLESTPIQTGTAPTLTYAAAAPHLNADGTARTGNFYALLPSNILTLFGTSVATFDPAILAVARTGDAGTFSTAWTPWTAAAGNGTDGQFLTISNISFSAPKFQVTRSSAAPQNASPTKKTTTVKIGKTISFAAIASGYSLKTSGSKLSAKVSTPKVCKVVGKAIKGLKAGTCKGTLTVTPKKGKSSKKGFSFAVVGGKRLTLALHHH